jgi:hypothetical protein
MTLLKSSKKGDKASHILKRHYCLDTLNIVADSVYKHVKMLF